MSGDTSNLGSETDAYPGLTRVERANVRIVERWHSVPMLSSLSTWMGRQTSRRGFELIMRNIVEYHHFERLRQANPHNSVMICANHRSYIDNFAVAVRALQYMPSDVRTVAPARTEGLYDRPWGIFLNFFLTSMNIYPPIVRSSRGVAWGKRVIEKLTELLLRGRIVLFIHPEGGRNKGNDPYRLLPARPGLGRIIYQTRAEVFPVFLHGFPRSPGAFLRANFRRRAGSKPLVYAVMGEQLDFSAERAMPPSPRLFKDIAQRVNEAILAASVEERELRLRAAGQRPSPLSDNPRATTAVR